MTPYYADDLVTLYAGDCREILPALTFDAIVSDPPYGMDYQHGLRKGGRQYGLDGASIHGDAEPFDPGHLLIPGKRVLLWGGNHFADRLPASRGWLIWDKRDGRPSNDQSDAEMAWTNFLNTARVHSRYWSGSVRTGREQAEGRLHVNQKPVALMGWCLRLLGPVGVVCDPYSGSGSTLLAAREMGIPSIGIEIDKAHCDTTIKRLAQGCLDFGEASWTAARPGSPCPKCGHQRDTPNHAYGCDALPLELADDFGGLVQVVHGAECVGLVVYDKPGLVLTPTQARTLASMLSRQAEHAEAS